MAVKAPDIEQSTTQGAWHTVDTDAVIRRLNVDLTNGISEQDAAARLAQYGANELVEKKLKSP